MRTNTKEPKEQLGNYRLETYYSRQDLSKLKLFKGNYINFGYWKHTNFSRRKKISARTRIKSSKNLYRLIFDHLSIKSKDKILEVGCGKGMGCVQLVKTHNPNLVVGMDIFNKQVKRAVALHRNFLKQNPSLKFRAGKAEKIPFETGSFTKLYSVEAAQHFMSVKKFIREARRVLSKNGVICLATFFSRRKGIISELKSLFPSIEHGSDKFLFIDDVLRNMKKSGFVNIRCKSIGKDVFNGFDVWMTQNGYERSWGREWLKAYNRGLVDYYVISASLIL